MSRILKQNVKTRRILISILITDVDNCQNCYQGRNLPYLDIEGRSEVSIIQIWTGIGYYALQYAGMRKVITHKKVDP